MDVRISSKLKYITKFLTPGAFSGEDALSGLKQKPFKIQKSCKEGSSSTEDDDSAENFVMYFNFWHY